MIVEVRMFRLFFLMPVIVFLCGLVALSYYPQLGVGAMLAAMAILAMNAIFIRCPKCGRSPYIRELPGRSILVPRLYSFPWVSSTCSACSHDMKKDITNREKAP